MSVSISDIAQLDILAGIETGMLEQLATYAVIRSYHSKMLIFLEGEPADWLYLLMDGNVKLYKAAANGQEKTILLLDKGEIFGESGLFTPGNYAVTAQTIEDSRLLLFPMNSFQQAAKKVPELSWRVADLLNLRLRRAYRQVRNQALMDTYSRLLSRLYKLTRDYGKQTHQGYRLDLNLTHQELANFIGSSRETVSRLMKDMEREGLIQVKDHHLVIADLSKLQHELETV